MNMTDKEHLLKISKQIEKYIDDIEAIQNKEYGKYNNLSEDEKNGKKRQTLENNCWLLQPLHDKLEEALSKYKAIQDLIDPSDEDFEIACMMANDYKRICKNTSN